MATVCELGRAMTRNINPAARGYAAVYHDGEQNTCPGCGRCHWIIGRLSAECAFCSTALPLKVSHHRPDAQPTIWQRGPRQQ